MQETKTKREERFWKALTEVMDPEFPISVVDMGLIYEIKEQPCEKVDIKMTYTASSCACMEWIESDIRERLLQEEDVKEVNINVVWVPAWTVDRLSDKAKEQLKHWGVSSK
ncbi:metal-sulfur cluster assembly factor [Halalkalibacter krulwichiae]|uniref:Putative 1,2-phenylacetyl-CoA epoxidase, subunit D n=1 Tax=Halalkalibacter krulwichiae TaxID=199441 RepID=A0A1X9M8L0_9BACI|nr:metal-sulfur cluster assembly factor [Halalkalibacter krulwichiae]ARK29748.1 Putative 1,2-phenylacetyl-CoA epoxidase, subunit D [Halalkalibacter krulwichiae]